MIKRATLLCFSIWLIGVAAFAEPSKVPSFNIVWSDLAEIILKEENDRVVAHFMMNEDRVQDWLEFTTKHQGREVRILLNGKLVMEPVIRKPHSGGRLPIETDSLADALALIDSLTKEQLPAEN